MIILLLRNIEIWVVKGFAFHYELVPLQICHFANFVLLIAFLKNHKTLFAFAWLFNFPAAFMSIVFANGLENYATILTLRGFAYISGHMLIVALSLFAFSSGFVKLNTKVLTKLYFLLLPLYITAHFVNMFFHFVLNSSSNYFYTVRPESGTPLELFHQLGRSYMIGTFSSNPVYLVLTALFGVLVTLVIYTATLYLTPKNTDESVVYSVGSKT